MMKWASMHIIPSLMLVVALTGCAPSALPPIVSQAPVPTTAPSPERSPTEAVLIPADVVMTVAERLSAGDLEGAMVYWADDAIFYEFGLPPDGSELTRGKENIRGLFAEYIADHLNLESQIISVVGNVVTSQDKTWLDFTRQIGVAPQEGRGQYLVEDGKISTYAWTLDAESLARLKTALDEVMPAELETEGEAEALERAADPVSELHVTISDGTCSYAGPLNLQAGLVQVMLEVQDQDREAYILTLLTLDPGKDFADLMAATVGNPPAWSRLLPYRELGPGESQTYGVYVTEGPVYAICWSKPPDHPIGNIGPFEVRQ